MEPNEGDTFPAPISPPSPPATGPYPDAPLPPPQIVGYYVGQPPKPFNEWRMGSFAFGIVAILFGSGAACLGLSTPLALLLPQPNGGGATVRAGALVGAALLYVSGAAAFFVWGVGAIRYRRWARPLAVTAGTIAAVSGILGVLSMAILWPMIRKAIAANAARGAPAPPASVLSTIMEGTIVFMAVVMVIVPAAFVWFYKHPRAKEMLEYYDPVPRWTDPCPLPVLGVSVYLVMFAATTLIGATRAAAPAFGTVLTGVPAVAWQLAVGAVALGLARLAFHRRPAAWWGAAAGLLLFAASTGLTLARRDLPDLYRRAGFGPQEVDAMRMGHPAMFVVTLPTLLLLAGYLVWVRRYFVAGRAPAGAGGAA